MKLSKSMLKALFFSVVFILIHMPIVSFTGEKHHQRMGQLAGAGGHHAEGSVDIQGHRLTLSNIDVDKVPDGRVYLTNDADYESGIELGRLTRFSGTVQYSIPEGINPDEYNSVLIWCKKFSVEIGHATLTGAEK